MTKDEDLWSDEICALVDAAFETVSRNPSDHEEAIAYRRAIAAALRQRTQSDIFDAGDVQKHTLIVDQDYSSHTVKVKSLDDSQPIQSDAVQADIDAMESILWVDTIIDDKVAIAKAFARHRQYGYDQGYYDGQRDRQLTQDNALREALEAAPIINLWESKEDFRRRQDGWLKTKYRAALQEQGK